MEQNLLLSVVIPVYNAETYIKRTIDSVIGQSLKDFELILVDDGSTDSTCSVINSYTDERIRLIKQENSYAGVARNTGLAASTGKYVLFLDGDDYFEPYMFEELVNQSEKFDAEICVCGARAYNERLDITLYRQDYLNCEMLPEDKECFSAADIANYIFNFTCAPAWNKLFLRSFILENNLSFMPLKRSNDFSFTYEALSLANRITTVRKPLLTYSTGIEGSLSATNDYTETFCFFEALKKLLNTLKTTGNEKLFRQSFNNRALWFCLYNLNKPCTEEEFKILYDALKSKIIPHLALVRHSRSYYYSVGDFNKLIYILEHNSEEAWNERINGNNRRDLPISPKDYYEANITPSNDTDSSIKVSVIVPIYNVEPYLGECLDTVINQTLKEIEIICVNDGSTDNSRDVVLEYMKKDSRIILIDQENGGLSAARNTGFKNSKGKYIYYFDSDDTMDIYALSILYAAAEKDNLDIVDFDANAIYDPEEIMYEKNQYKGDFIRQFEIDEVLTGRQFFLKQNELEKFKVNVWLNLYRRDFIVENNLEYIDKLLFEDIVFTMQALSCAKRVKHVNLILYNRRVRPGSIMTTSEAIRDVYNIIRCLKILMDYYYEAKIYEDVEYSYGYLDYVTRVWNSSWKKTKVSEEAIEAANRFIKELDFTAYAQVIRDASLIDLRVDAKNDIFKKHELEERKKEIRKRKKTIEERNQQISKLEKESKDKSGKITKLEKESKDKSSKISNLEKESKDKSNKITNLEKESKDKSSKISNLEKESKDKSTKISNLEKESEKKSNKISNLEKESKDKSTKITKLEKESEKKSNKISNLEGKLSDTQKKLNKKTDDYNNVTNSVSFKIGRFITYIPRKIKKLIKKK